MSSSNGGVVNAMANIDEQSSNDKVDGWTPHGTAAETTKQPVLQQHGRPTLVASFGSFPGAGSRLGPFFCLGRLGRGTFCSIHRCIDLRYFHSPNKHRLVAAKVELSTFSNSGVLEGEAQMLNHLHASMPTKSVPAYMGHYRANEASAIVMQYLPGEDMHQLRHRQQRRRLSIKDAVYLTADVMLPLLKEMHNVAVVHRDVKPSNCVRMGTCAENKEFCIVDFGLSKSIVVPRDSTYADTDHAWTGTAWNIPPNATSREACLRKERPTAEFRGTSMYASLRVHQLRDYSRRDDMWSLLYVFCDLVSGGLPWMSNAANRERDECQKLKEQIHGDDENDDKTERMLMGEEYYVSYYNREVAKKKAVEEKDLPALAEPLPMAKDEKKVELLRKAFNHVAQLKFADKPDYDLIKDCLKGFLETEQEETVKPVDWNYVPQSFVSINSKKRSRESRQLLPTWDLADYPDPLDEDVLEEADAERKSQSNIGEPEKKLLESHERDMARLPLSLQFRVAQMEYNTKNASTIAPHLALRDWIKCTLQLLYGKWDSSRYEKGNHRTNADGYRREVYLKLLEKCQKGAEAFDYFRDRSCFYEKQENGGAAAQDAKPPQCKRRKIITGEDGESNNGAALLTFSKAMFGMRLAIEAERQKKFAPPPALSFGSGVGESAMT